jgi:hypothetical protein
MVGMGAEAVESMQTMPAVIHKCSDGASPEDRRDRQKVNDATRRNAWRELNEES